MENQSTGGGMTGVPLADQQASFWTPDLYVESDRVRRSSSTLTRYFAQGAPCLSKALAGHSASALPTDFYHRCGFSIHLVQATRQHGIRGCKTLYTKADCRPKDLGQFLYVRNHPVPCRLVLIKKKPKGRHHTTVHKKRTRRC
jgi:hypothetical protein